METPLGKVLRLAQVQGFDRKSPRGRLEHVRSFQRSGEGDAQGWIPDIKWQEGQSIWRNRGDEALAKAISEAHNSLGSGDHAGHLSAHGYSRQQLQRAYKGMQRWDYLAAAEGVANAAGALSGTERFGQSDQKAADRLTGVGNKLTGLAHPKSRGRSAISKWWNPLGNEPNSGRGLLSDDGTISP